MSSSPYSTIVPSNSDINDAIPPLQVIIALPAIVPPPMFNSQDFFPSKKISSPKDDETPVKSPIPISSSSSFPRKPNNIEYNQCSAAEA
ncbi:hypothetical protein Tco_1036036 [Tanacetum coccineum]